MNAIRYPGLTRIEIKFCRRTESSLPGPAIPGAEPSRRGHLGNPVDWLTVQPFLSSKFPIQPKDWIEI